MVPLQKLQPFFPPLEPLQSRNLRDALLRCLNELKRRGVFGRDIFLRKSIFDDCKGEKLQEILVAFSSAVLLQAMASERIGKQSVAGQLCLASNLSKQESDMIPPMIIAHRASLRHILAQKDVSRTRLQALSLALNQKANDLDNKFDKIIRNQEFLDEHVPSEGTVSRVAKVFSENWQANSALLDVIGAGEDTMYTDLLLDQGFPVVWDKIKVGSFDGSIGLTKHGLLESLEQRVNAQSLRLKQWKGYRDDLLRDKRSTKAGSVHTPENPILQSPKAVEKDSEIQRQKEMVFSPRKSPRKSVLRQKSLHESTSELTNPQQSQDSGANNTTLDTGIHTIREATATPVSKHCQSQSVLSSGADQLDQSLSPSDAKSLSSYAMLEYDKDLNPSAEPSRNGQQNYLEMMIGDRNNDPEQTSNASISTQATKFRKPVVKTSLEERTRQSMNHGAQRDPTSKSPVSHTPSTRTVQYSTNVEGESDAGTTLLERTRQTISLIPPNSTSPQKFKHTPRPSRTHSTNSFRTPRNENTMQPLTPPEERIKIDLGYDSVFKSRPKIANSPATSPIHFSLNNDMENLTLQ